MISITREFLAKSVDAITCRLEKLVANQGAHIEFQIKAHAVYFLLIFINCSNYILKINYSFFKEGVTFQSPGSSLPAIFDVKNRSRISTHEEPGSP